MNSVKPYLILCLGNDIISDDGFGPQVAQTMLEIGDLPQSVEVLSASLGGFNLLEYFTNREKVLIVDTIITGEDAPGTLRQFSAGIFTPGNNLISSHQISLPAVLEFGKIIGVNMPKVVDVLTVEAGDIETIGCQLTPPVLQAVEHVPAMIRKWISQNIMEDYNYGR